MEAVKDKFLLNKLKEFFGYDKFKGYQQEVINSIMSGKDTFVIMPTGGGKSMCYQLPALLNEGTAIIISPLIALMKNQVDSIRSFGNENAIAHFYNSSLNKQERENVKLDVVAGKTKLLYVAPESLNKDENVDFLQHVKISFYAIDEAHCISEWGHDFRPEYRRIRTIIERIGSAPIIALTATATPKVQQDIQKNLKMMDADVYKSSFNRPNLYYEVRPKKNATKDIIRFIKENPNKSGIVYCLSRRKVEELAETLQINGIKALPYHAGMDAISRSRNQDMFLMEDVEVIVATIAFGMGIDKPDVRFVIHYNMPKSLEGYYQETGRAGRDGGEGKCIAYYTYNDIEKLEKLLKGKPVAEQEIGRHLLMEIVAYSESAVCRRKSLLHYFGEEYEKDNCHSCSNCLNPKKQFEGKEELFLLLKCIVELKEQFKSNHIVSVLLGEQTNDVKDFNHKKLYTFGKGKGTIQDIKKDGKYWNAIIRQALIHGYLIKDIENYGILKMSNKGIEFIEKPKSIKLSKDHDYDQTEEQEKQVSTQQESVGDKTLFAMLKDLRKDIAKRKNLPPYVIFQDTSLEDMTIQYPITLEEMKQITGVGEGKAHKFGQEFVDLINKYVKENDIERPSDMIVKSVVNKSGVKVYIIQNIDRKRDLNDIAEAKGLTFIELIHEIEAIVSAGTKLDISYYVREAIDDERVEDIYQYFKEGESESIIKAIDELEEDGYEEEEIRLVRIMFISDFGN